MRNIPDQCPKCGGPIKWDKLSNLIECSYCGKIVVLESELSKRKKIIPNFKKNFSGLNQDITSKINGFKKIEISKIPKYFLIILLITFFPSIYILNSNRKLSKTSSSSIVVQKDDLSLIHKIEKALNNNNFSLLQDFFENEESIKVINKLRKFKEDFPNANWQITKKLGN